MTLIRVYKLLQCLISFEYVQQAFQQPGFKRLCCVLGLDFKPVFGSSYRDSRRTFFFAQNVCYDYKNGNIYAIISPLNWAKLNPSFVPPLFRPGAGRRSRTFIWRNYFSLWNLCLGYSAIPYRWKNSCSSLGLRKPFLCYNSGWSCSLCSYCTNQHIFYVQYHFQRPDNPEPTERLHPLRFRFCYNE